MGGVVDILNMGNQVVVTTGYGILHRLSWEGSFHSALAVNINHVPLANDLRPESRGVYVLFIFFEVLSFIFFLLSSLSSRALTSVSYPRVRVQPGINLSVNLLYLFFC